MLELRGEAGFVEEHPQELRVVGAVARHSPEHDVACDAPAKRRTHSSVEM